MMAEDIFGQEIKVGSKVVWVGGKTQYAGVKVFEVIKVTDKQCRLYDPDRFPTDRREDLFCSSSISFDCVVVVDKLV